MKKITLFIVIFLTTFLSNAQTPTPGSDCDNAIVLNIPTNTTITVNDPGVSGTPPTDTCASMSGHTNNQISKANWYTYYNSHPTQDYIVSIKFKVSDIAEYFPTAIVYSGTCISLYCHSAASVAQFDEPVILSFVARASNYYYLVFDDFYNYSVQTGTTAPFSFEVSVTSILPGAASNPTPADMQTDVNYYASQDTQGNAVTAVDLSWDAPSTGVVADSYLLEMTTDPVFSTGIYSETLTTTSVTGFYIPGDPNYFADNTSYYWRVTPRNLFGTTQEPVSIWSFTTGVLGVDDLNRTRNFEFYTNHGELYLRSQVIMDDVKVFNLLGQQVVSKEAVNGKSTQITIASLPNGLYIGQVSIDGQEQSFKFVKGD